MVFLAYFIEWLILNSRIDIFYYFLPHVIIVIMNVIFVLFYCMLCQKWRNKDVHCSSKEKTFEGIPSWIFSTILQINTQSLLIWHVNEWVSEWLNLTAFLWTAGSKVHIVHISCVITTYTLESLSSLSEITHNLQATINFKKKRIKKRTTKKCRHPLTWQIIGEKDSGSVYIINLHHLTKP